MTPVQARVALSRPLVFGDQEQLQARAIMEQVEQVVGAILKCNHAYDPKRKTPCSCLSSFPFGILRAAVLDSRLQFTSDRERVYWIKINC